MGEATVEVLHDGQGKLGSHRKSAASWLLLPPGFLHFEEHGQRLFHFAVQEDLIAGEFFQAVGVAGLPLGLGPY